MSSYTISVSGTSPRLQSFLFPPIHLNGNSEWEAALLDFTTYNSIPNVIENVNNHFYYKKNYESTVLETIKLKTGAYELEDINKCLKEMLGSENINLEGNNSLLKTEIISKFVIDFSQPKGMGDLLGFTKDRSSLLPNLKHLGDKTVNIIKVNVINIACNIVHGAYQGGRDGHILHSCYPSVAPGYRFLERPNNLVYLPVKVSMISEIVLDIIDQDGDPIDFQGETITVRLHIKERS